MVCFTLKNASTGGNLSSNINRSILLTTNTILSPSFMACRINFHDVDHNHHTVRQTRNRGHFVNKVDVTWCVDDVNKG